LFFGGGGRDGSVYNDILVVDALTCTGEFRIALRFSFPIITLELQAKLLLLLGWLRVHAAVSAA
jgi:hypothetical protein